MAPRFRRATGLGCTPQFVRALRHVTGFRTQDGELSDVVARTPPRARSKGTTMSGRRLLLLLTVMALAGFHPAAAAGTGPSSAERLYLLASDSGHPYWTIDRTDPELDSGPVVNVSGPT